MWWSASGLRFLWMWLLGSMVRGKVNRPSTDTNGNYESDEQRLFKKLMKNYEKSVRPVYNVSTPVVVQLGITLTQIFGVQWKDEKMSWNPRKFGNITKLRMPCKFLWLPDIVLYNSVDDYTNPYMQSLAMVESDGTVFWPPIVRFRSTCKIDITFFPFDDQICWLKMGSWAYDGFQVDVTNRSGTIDLSNYVDNGEWILVDAKAVRTVKYYTCCPEPFPDVTFYLQMRRRTLYYTFNIIVPCVILSTLTIASFILPADSGEKVTLGLTVLLAFSVFMLLIAENMPPTSEYVPLIGIYLTVIMAMTSFSVVLAVFILHVHHKGCRRERAPEWMRHVVFDYLGRVMCLRRQRQQSNNFMEEEGCVSMRVRNDYSVYNRGYRRSSNVNLSDSEQEEALIKKENRRNEIFNRDFRRTEDEVLRHLKILIERQNQADQDMDIVREWEDIAAIIDRFLFWIFFSLGISATFALLVFKPMTKDKTLN